MDFKRIDMRNKKHMKNKKHFLAEQYERLFEKKLISENDENADWQRDNVFGRVSFQHYDYMTSIPSELYELIPNAEEVRRIAMEVDDGEEEPGPDDPILYELDDALKEGVSAFVIERYQATDVGSALSDDVSITVDFLVSKNAPEALAALYQDAAKYEFIKVHTS